MLLGWKNEAEENRKEQKEQKKAERTEWGEFERLNDEHGSVNGKYNAIHYFRRQSYCEAL